jgi:hypothetical protein
MTDNESRPGYEPFPVQRRRTWLNALDGKLRRRLPRGAYQSMLGGYYGLRKATGRNPGRGRVLPDFVILGAAKAGTTSLYAWLSEHPEVTRAAAKEIHYFSFYYERGTDWYRHFFPLERERKAFAAEHGRPFITGEASPSYLLDPSVPARMAELIPDAKLIVSLREPVERAYSQFQMRRRDQKEPVESFIGAMAAEDPSLQLDGRPLAQADVVDIGRTYLARGRYAEQLERWLQHFRREQIHIVAMEDLAADPQGILDGVHQFLGLPPRNAEDLAPRFVSEYDPLPEDARRVLGDYFRPHNQRLYELLGRDFGWER